MTSVWEMRQGLKVARLLPGGVQRGGRRSRGSRWCVLAALLGLGALTGCSLDSLLHRDQLPPDVSDPVLTQTPNGAREAYIGTLHQFSAAFGSGVLGAGGGVSFVAMTGLLSDELSENVPSLQNTLDRRALPEGQSDGADGTYSAVQKVRGQAGQAIGLLTQYLPDQPALAGHLYAIRGYAELFLAELFCSGIPLSTLDYQGDFTYRPGSTTVQVLTHAVALFDTALARAGDSTRVVNLARVGKGRALLALDSVAAAAAAVAAVPDGYHYDVTYSNLPDERNIFALINGMNNQYNPIWAFTVLDGEGGNGLDWRTSGDPRTPVSSYNQTGSPSFTNYRPSKYDSTGASAIVLADAVEARLIGAEAALQANDPAWLAMLNALRTDGTFGVTATSPPDTLWHAGSGGTAGLRPLTDPGTASGRVDLLFRERAFWLFLTGHRQGDLRRLIRQYGRTADQVYPVGEYGPSSYGSDVTAPVPAAEKLSNTLYTGCISRDA